MFNFIIQYNTIERASIIAAIIIAEILVVTLLLVIFRPRPKKELLKYFYAFTSGFLLVIAVLGLFGESREIITDHFNHKVEGLNVLYVILVILGAIIFTLGLLFLVKNIETSGKNKGSKNMQKWIGIILTLSHRIPAAISIGLLVSKIETEWAILIAIMLHIIPEIMLIYYRQMEMKYPLKVVVRNSILINLVFFPLIIIGSLIGQWIEKVWWLQSGIFFMTGLVMSYGTIIEFIPEYINFMAPHVHTENFDFPIHSKGLDHMHDVVNLEKEKRKSMMYISLWLIIGIALAALILVFH